MFGISQSFAAVESEEIGVSKDDLLYTTESLTQNQLEECEEIYENDYAILDENAFSQRYLYHKFAGNCVMLFDDPIWSNDDRTYEQLSERLSELVQKRLDAESERKKIFFIEPKSVIELQIPETYLFTFEGCTGEAELHASDILLASDKEVISLVGFAEQDRVVPPETCSTVELQIKAYNPDSIRVLVAGQQIGLSKPEMKLEVEPMKAEPTLEETEQVVVTSIRKSDLTYVTRDLSENEIKDCEDAYTDYTTLGESQFSTRYLYHPHMGNCVMLYDDPVWETDGDDRYEKLSDKLSSLVNMREAERIQLKSQTMFIDIKSITDLQIEGSYLVEFEGCSGSRYVNLDDIVISSDTETLQAVPPGAEGRFISPGRCGISEYQIRADDPDSIKVVIPAMAVEDVMARGGFTLMSPVAQMEHGTDAKEVLCKEGLQLVIKSSDGSAACVKTTSVDRLVERGWASLV